MSDLRFLKELGAEFDRVAPAYTERPRRRRQATALVRGKLAISGVLMLAVSAVVTAGVAAVFLIALGPGRHKAPSVSGPPGSAVPVGFDPLSVSATSSRRWWVLGFRPCSAAACLAIVRTTDGGRSFVSIPSPPRFTASNNCPSGLTFADARDGFAYDCALYVTHDGGAHWRKLNLGGSVYEFAAGGGDAYAIVGGSRRVGRSGLMRSPVGRDAWATLHPPEGSGGDELGSGLAARGGDVFALASIGLLISHDRGAHFAVDRRGPFANALLFVGPQGCSFRPVTTVVVWALCGGGPLLRSTDGGQSFVSTPGHLPPALVLGAVSTTTAVVGGDRLMRTTNEGRSYTRVGPTGLVWEDLTFTDARHGIGIATPASSAVQGFAAPAALSPANSCVYVTNDGGASYQPVSIVSAVRCGLPSTYGVRCKASQLRLALGPEVSEATEQNTLILLVRNIAETGCDLRGYPRIALLDKHGATLPFAYRRSGDQMLTSRPPTLVPLAPYYGDAYLGVNKNTCEAGDHGIATQIRVTLPGQRHTLRLRLGRYPIMGYCTIQPGHTVDLTPVEPTGAATGYRH